MTVCTTIGGMVMTVRWNGDDCERGVTVLCVQPWVEW